MAQLVRIRAVVEQRYGLKEENKEEDRDNEEGSKDGPRKSQKKVKERTLLSASYQNSVLFLFLS